MLKNKHLVLAMIIAPILAVIAYFGVDFAVSEKPHTAKSGGSYKLVARSNCRYTSGICSLVNGDFRLQLRAEALNKNDVTLSLSSPYALDGAKINLSDAPKNAPRNMSPEQEDGKKWFITLTTPQNDDSVFYLAVKSGDTLYYAEAPTTFIEYKTFFTESQQN